VIWHFLKHKNFTVDAIHDNVTSSDSFTVVSFKRSFPIRHRIVAGMTLGTVVVEGSLTSGALLTARMANDNCRQVFAVPGRTDSTRTKDCHDLIKNGAKLCEGVEDILSEFEYLFPTSNRPSPLKDASAMPAFTLSTQEQAVYDALLEEESTTDEVIRRSRLPPSTVSVALLGLEMKRLIRQLPGKLDGRLRWHGMPIPLILENHETLQRPSRRHRERRETRVRRAAADCSTFRMGSQIPVVITRT